jgi:hypothetical protein
MTGKYPAFEKFVTDFSNTLQSNEAGTVSRTSSVASLGNAFGQMSITPSRASQRQPNGAAQGPPRQRLSLYDRTPSEIAFEENLEIIIEDDTKPPGYVEQWLPVYFVPSWIKYRDSERRKIPFSVLIYSKDKKELRDLEELWDDYNNQWDPVTKKLVNNPRGYFLALLDGKTDALTMVQQKCGTGIESYKNVLKCLLLFNLKRIHKIVEWEDEEHLPGIPIYDKSPNRIFKHINIQTIFDGGTLNEYESEFVNIMNQEATNLYAISAQTNITSQSSPFVDMNEYDQLRNDAFFTLTNSNFRIFLNRVCIRYWKSLRYHKKF